VRDGGKEPVYGETEVARREALEVDIAALQKECAETLKKAKEARGAEGAEVGEDAALVADIDKKIAPLRKEQHALDEMERVVAGKAKYPAAQKSVSDKVVDDLEAQAVPGDLVAGLRRAPELAEDEAGERVVVLLRQTPAELLVEVVDREGAVDSDRRAAGGRARAPPRAVEPRRCDACGPPCQCAASHVEDDADAHQIRVRVYRQLVVRRRLHRRAQLMTGPIHHFTIPHGRELGGRSRAHFESPEDLRVGAARSRSASHRFNATSPRIASRKRQRTLRASAAVASRSVMVSGCRLDSTTWSESVIITVRVLRPLVASISF
jgi:hypothetical protein